MAKASDNASDLLRGSTPTLVLAVLGQGSAHGYAIARKLNERAGEPLRMKQGTLYPVLHALERDGLVKGQWEHPDGERPRKIYVITDAGRIELKRRTSEWREFMNSVNSILGVTLEPG